MLYDRLDTVLAALEHAATPYDTATDDIKRRLNQALFKPFQIDPLDEYDQAVPEALAEVHCTTTGALTAPAAAVAALAGRTGGNAPRVADSGRESGPGAHAETLSKLALTRVSNVNYSAGSSMTSRPSPDVVRRRRP